VNSEASLFRKQKRDHTGNAKPPSRNFPRSCDKASEKFQSRTEKWDILSLISIRIFRRQYRQTIFRISTNFGQNGNNLLEELSSIL
jgi:hypothetical protein